jgi:hypothetical protein
MIWISPTPAPFVDGPVQGDMRPMLEGFLAWQRHSLLNICAGLTGEQLALRAVEPSSLSLLGLLRHMAKVERIWFRIRIAEQAVEPLYPPGTDIDFDDIDPDRAEFEYGQYLEECRLADAAVSDIPLDTMFRSRDETLSVKFLYLHMIGEYARHNGHADLLRECIDGTTGA